MPAPSELSGENRWLNIDGVSYKIRDSGSIDVNLTPRTFNARGSGDDAPRPKPAGLADDAQVAANEVISTDEAIMSLNGTYATVKEMDGAATRTELADAYLQIRKTSNIGDLIVFAVEATPTAVPTTPDLSHLAY